MLDVVAPPAKPFEPLTGPWEALEAELGTTLPQDFKDFVRLYGSGYFMDFLGVSIPRTRNPNTRFETEVALICQTFAEWDDDELPHPVWPATGGLIPFGVTDNGDVAPREFPDSLLPRDEPFQPNSAWPDPD